MTGWVVTVLLVIVILGREYLGRERGKWEANDLTVPPYDGSKSMHTYYGGHEITKAVEDIWSPISSVILAVEHQIMREVRASKSYTDDPSLIYSEHPWMKFVRSGGAEYLGWPRDHVPGPSPLERRRQYRPLSQQTPKFVAVGEEKPTVDLHDMMVGGLLDAGEMVPIIAGYDLNGQPIHRKRKVEINDPDTGEHLGDCAVCECGDCDSEPWDDRLRNGG